MTTSEWEETSIAMQSLWADESDAESFPDKRPLLAHYTTLDTIENILKNEQIWLSHPLFMNDLQELRFGIHESREAFLNSETLKRSFQSDQDYEYAITTYLNAFDKFASEHAFDLYIFCLAEHSSEDNDGLLSMWRGYGAHGNGAALVFDTSKLIVMEHSPLIISKVWYASEEDRRDWIEKKIQQFAGLVKNNSLTGIKLYYATTILFERIKLFSLFTKHKGFSEELEWRVVYDRQRDHQNLLIDMLSYHIGPTGIQPKLKLELKKAGAALGGETRLSDILHSIILGPSHASPLANATVKRMLEKIDKRLLSERLVTSSTPYRATR